MHPVALLLLSAVSSVNARPFSFTPNRGQTAQDVEWEARGKNYGLALDGRGASLSLRMAGPLCAPTANVRLDLVGATARRLEGVEPLPGIVNSYTGDRSTWRSGLPTFGKVKHVAAWPGIDVVYYGTDGKLELDFVVQPGADLDRVMMEVSGAQAAITAEGALRIRTAGGELELPAPVVYQLVDGERQLVAGRYMLRGAGRVGFTVGEYDQSQPLVIDPVVVYSSYFGGNSDDFVYSAAVDSAGSLYIAGVTSSTDLPLPVSPQPSPAPPHNNNSGETDAFVAKIATGGSTLLYSTYLGGSGFDDGKAIAVDGSGNAYVTGYTDSTDFPTLQALQGSSGGGGRDIFVAMLGPTGALAYSTYLGAGGFDFGDAIAVDTTGAAYIGGSTDTSFPKAGGGSWTVDAAGDALVAKIAPRPVDGVTPPALVYTAIIGGSGLDYAQGIALDGAKSAYITGATTSDSFPICANGPCASPSPGPMRPGMSDAFVTKLNPAGDQLVYSRLLGGAQDEIGRAIAVEAGGSAYVSGHTNSNDFPTLNAFQSTFAMGTAPEMSDVFVTKLSPNGATLTYSTYLGGTGDDQGAALAIDPSGAVYVGGVTRSTNFPVTSTAVMGTLPNAGGSAFVARITASGSGLGWGTYFGGTDNASSALAVATDGAGNTYAAGFTDATDMTVKNAVTDKHAFQEGFVVKLGPTAEPPVISFIVPPSSPADTNTAVTIVGANFVSGAAVTFDSVACGSITVVNAETITCTTPRHAAGNVTVAVTNPDMQSDTTSFTFDAPTAPTLTSLTPTMGPAAGGTVVTISGAKIGAAATVTFGGVAATSVAIPNSTQITATTPAHAIGAVDVVVSNGTGLSTTLTNAFTYTETMSDAPTVSVVTPNAGPTAGGTRVSVLGNSFASGATVEIGGSTATAVTVVNDTTILATTPAGTAGPADVTVTNPDGQSGTLTGGFTYGSGSSALSVLRVIPSEGDDDGGERVLVIGANFAAGVQVTFGGAPATGIQVVDTNQLSVLTPAHAVGAVDVVATNLDGQTATLTGGFVYKSGGTGCDCDVGGSTPTAPWGGLVLLLLVLVARRFYYSSSSTSSVFQYDASTNPKNGSHSR